MGFLGDVFGSKPSVPAWQNVSLPAAQTAAVGENISALPQIENLATGVNTFNQQQLTQLMNSIMPGWSGAAGTAMGNITSELGGKIPTDVAGNVQSSAAAQALTGGFGGSGLAGNLTAKDLGITSLDLTNQGLSAFESWSQMIDKMFEPGQFNITSMFVSPEEQFKADFENAQQAWQAQWLQSQVSAMGDPITQGLLGMSLFGNKNAGLVMGGSAGSGGGGGSSGGGGLMGYMNSMNTGTTSDYGISGADINASAYGAGGIASVLGFK